MKLVNKFLIIAVAFSNFSCATLLDSEKEYRRMLNDIKADSLDFSFMQLRQYLSENPNTAHTKEIRFALAEYYFLIKDYRDAAEELTSYISEFESDKNTIFAYSLLYKIISEYKAQEQMLDKIKEKFFSKSLFLIFSDSKTQHYKSILKNTYKIIEHIDRIEVFYNNELFFKVAP